MNNGTFGKEVKIFEPTTFEDYRGEIWTTWKKDEFKPNIEFNHDKVSTSRKNVIRGMHGDTKSWKLATCLSGEIYYVVVDYRKDSSTYLKWDWIILSEYNKKLVLVPPNFVNGFCVLSDKMTLYYKWAYPGGYPDVEDQITIKWNDPSIGINWPCDTPFLQERDM